MDPQENLIREADDLLRRCRALQAAGSGPFLLPSLIESLEGLSHTIEASFEERRRHAAGFGRILTDDYEFMETSLAEDLADFVNTYAEWGE